MTALEEVEENRRRPRCNANRKTTTGKFFRYEWNPGTDVRAEVFRLASDRHWEVRELTARGDAEDVFVEITHSDET